MSKIWLMKKDEKKKKKERHNKGKEVLPSNVAIY